MRHTGEGERYFTGPSYVGPGRFKICCYHCGNDDLYAGHELQRFKADHNYTPQENSINYEDRRAVEDRIREYQHAEPLAEVAMLVGNLCAACAHLESQLLRLMFGLENIFPLSAKHISARFDYNSCISTSIAISKDRGNAEALEFIKSVSTEINAMQRERNLFVHGYIIQRQQHQDYVWVSVKGSNAFVPQEVDFNRILKAYNDAVSLTNTVSTFCDKNSYPDTVLWAIAK